MPAEVVLALADIAHARIRPMILVAGFAGLRYGELRALRLRSYDRLHGTLTVRESIDKRSRRKTTKTDSSQRTVTLHRFVLDAIDAHLTTFVSGDPDDPLFPGEAGGIISDGWFQREWRAARAALGLDEVHFHDLRHAAGTIATQQGATMREVMARLGHSTTSAAIRYQKAAADRDRALAERLDELVDGLRTSANADDSGSDPADRPAGAAGFSRGARLTRQYQRHPETEESPAVAGDSLEHPQRDSNPCRHLESSTRAIRRVRSSAGRPMSSGLSVQQVRRGRCRQHPWITNRITSRTGQATAALSASSWICSQTRSPSRLMTRAGSGGSSSSSPTVTRSPGRGSNRSSAARGPWLIQHCATRSPPTAFGSNHRS
ncbi:MAG: site-specific integrase [Microthrixaceae bacterium]